MTQARPHARAANGASGWTAAPTLIRGSGIYQLDKDRVPARDFGVSDARLPRLPRQHRELRPVRADRSMGVGLGRADADRQDLLPGLRSADLPAKPRLPAVGGHRRHLAALPRRPRRSQLFRHARTSTTTDFPNPTFRSSSRSSIRCSTTATSFGQPVFGGELGYRVNLTSLYPRRRVVRSDHDDGDRQLAPVR